MSFVTPGVIVVNSLDVIEPTRTWATKRIGSFDQGIGMQNEDDCRTNKYQESLITCGRVAILPHESTISILVTMPNIDCVFNNDERSASSKHRILE